MPMHGAHHRDDGLKGELGGLPVAGWEITCWQEIGAFVAASKQNYSKVMQVACIFATLDPLSSMVEGRMLT